MTTSSMDGSTFAESDDSLAFGIGDGALRHAFMPKDEETLLQRDLAHGPVGTAVEGHLPKSAGRFVLAESIGRGGMGVVLRAKDPDLGRDVALKILDQRLSSRDDFVARLQEEARIGGRLEHPGMVPVYEAGVLDDGRPWFVMKLVSGQTLKDLLADRDSLARDQMKFLQIFEQVCMTVAYAHDQGVLHRDLKPSNIMVGEFGEVLVMDWGLAKALGQGGASEARDDATKATGLEASPLQSQAGTVMGTPAFMAPEQARGEAATSEATVDVFGLGAILSQILTGRPPWDADSSVSSHEMAARGDLEKIRKRLQSAGTRSDLRGLTLSCLEPDPKLRPQDGRAVAEAMAGIRTQREEQVRKSEMDAARAESQLRVAKRQRRLLMGLAIATLCALAAVLWGMFVQQQQDEQARSANRDATAALIDAELAAEAESSNPLASPDTWRKVAASARQAQALTGVNAVDDELRKRSSSLLQRVESELNASNARLQQKKRRQEVESQLDSIAEQVSTKVESNSRESLYGELFKAEGWDVAEIASPAGRSRIALLIRAGPAPERAAIALISWGLMRRMKGAEGDWQSLLLLSQDVDADSWRSKLREALLSEKPNPQLLEIARSPTLAQRDPKELDILAEALDGFGEPAACRNVLSRGHEAWPLDYVLAHQFGIQLLKYEGEAPLIVQVFSHSSSLRPEKWQGWFHLAYGLRLLGKDDLAERHMVKAQKLAPEMNEPVQSLCLHYSRQGKMKKALECSSMLRKANPEDPEYMELHGQMLIENNRAAEGAELLERAVALDAKLASAWSNLCLVYARFGRAEESVTAGRRALALDPNSSLLLMNLALSLMGVGELPEAIELAERAATLGAAHAQAFTAEIYLRMFHELGWERAEAAFRQEPSSAVYCTIYVRALLDQGRFREAEKAAKQLEEPHEVARGRIRVGPILRDIERSRNLRKLCEQGATIGVRPPTGVGANHWARHLLRMGLTEMSAKVWSQFLEGARRVNPQDRMQAAVASMAVSLSTQPFGADDHSHREFRARWRKTTMKHVEDAIDAFEDRAAGGAKQGPGYYRSLASWICAPTFRTWFSGEKRGLPDDVSDQERAHWKELGERLLELAGAAPYQ